ncbi:MAG: hypothetical protein ACYC1C_15345 [Chloroflexota bacterium]
MRVLAKTLSVIVMVVSAVLLFFLLVGVGGLWWGRGEAVQTVTNLTEQASSNLDRLQGVVAKADQEVQQSKATVDQLSTQIKNAGGSAGQTSAALSAAEATFNNLSSSVQQQAQRAKDLQDSSAAIGQVLALTQSVSGSSDSQLADIANATVEKTTALQQTVADVQQEITNAKSVAADQVAGRLTGPLDNASSKLSGLSGDLGQISQRIDTAQANLVTLRDRTTTAITLIAVGLTFALLWASLAQLGLFFHAYGVFNRRDPLAGWHDRPEA